MLVAESNWEMVGQYLSKDDRAILPIGSTEQHAYLSLCTDFILSSRLAADAGKKSGVLVYPGIPFGMTPYFMDFPGTVNIRPATYGALVCDVLDSLYRHGVRRVMLLNGHGGNSPVQAFVGNWLNEHTDARVILHNWWNAPKVAEYVKSITANASHASWMENFPWNRIPGAVLPNVEKPAVNVPSLRQLPAEKVRAIIGDGNYGGEYQRSDDEMMRMWEIGITETCELLETGWVA